jgi:hypothetical protein
MSNKSIATIATTGIDIGKNSFHVVGLDQRGAIVLRQKWSLCQIGCANGWSGSAPASSIRFVPSCWNAALPCARVYAFSVPNCQALRPGLETQTWWRAERDGQP